MASHFHDGYQNVPPSGGVGSRSDPEAAPSLAPRPSGNSHSAPASVPEHAAVITEAGHVCIECGSVEKTKHKLDSHGAIKAHSPFACTCGRRFARSDILTRHLKTKNNTQPQHPCPYCKRHRGKSAFHRRDHLKQHIVEYHKFDNEETIPCIKSSKSQRFPPIGVCHEPTCPDYRDTSFYFLSRFERNKMAPFLKLSEYNKHMRDAHSITPFPCPASGCGRVGAKGYIREKDLMNHHRSMHPDRQPYLPTVAR
ncbi:AMP-binding enzyme [Ilyonectria robusta]